MPVRMKIPYPSGMFYITITCARWNSLFELTNGYDIVYNWFDYLKLAGHYINAYVIMPNHLHAIITFTPSEKPINTIVGNGKRFMSYEIIKRLQKIGDQKTLFALQSLVNHTDLSRDKKHEVFEPSFDWKYLDNDQIIETKLTYIHENPCRGLNPLCSDPKDYLYSSYRSYNGMIENSYTIKTVYEMDVIKINT